MGKKKLLVPCVESDTDGEYDRNSKLLVARQVGEGIDDSDALS